MKSTEIAAISSDQPRIAITLGDPAGIGPEVILKALADTECQQGCRITIVGSRSILLKTHQHLLSQQQQGRSPQTPLADPSQCSILDVPLPSNALEQIQWGMGNAASGAASFTYLETAIAATLAGQFDAIVTGPIAKSAWQAAGHDYPGQTELLATQAGSHRFGMLFAAESPQTGWQLRTLLATTHIPLRQVPDRLTPDLMTAKLTLLIDALKQDFGLPASRIAIAGLNPHSGEQGHLGHEEQDWLIPWLQQMRHQYPTLTLDGPVPPDTLWLRPAQAWHQTTAVTTAHDAYLALYHDQGLIPVKMLAFDRAVNVTIGLPFIRTSPDHGTAFDIAGQGIASATSLQQALQLAVAIARQRHQAAINQIAH